MTLDDTVQKWLKAARDHAKQGNVPGMNIPLELARRRTVITGQDIFAQVARIEKTGYEKAVPIELEAARGYAEQGDASAMSNRLYFAGIYAGKVGQNISAQVKQIRALVQK